jgi:hypothetical protein
MQIIILYEDDIQLFLSLLAADFAYNNISHLEHTISAVYNRMSLKFLSINPSETEFRLVYLPQQLSKFNNPMIHLPYNITLSPVNSARKLGVIFDRNLTLPQQISTVS